MLVLGNAEGIIKNNKNPKDLTNLVPGLSADETTIPLDLSTFRNNPKKFKPSLLETTELYKRLKEAGELSEKKSNEIRTEIQKRHSFAVACFAFGNTGINLRHLLQKDDQLDELKNLILNQMKFKKESHHLELGDTGSTKNLSKTGG